MPAALESAVSCAEHVADVSGFLVGELLRGHPLPRGQAAAARIVTAAAWPANWRARES